MQSHHRTFTFLSILILVALLAGSLPDQAVHAHATEPPAPKLVKDINPGLGGSNPRNPFVYHGMTFFRAEDGVHGDELWRTDGTADGTLMVKDINPGANSSSPTPLAVVNDVLLFAANDGTSGLELWRTDGTEAGTVMVKNINPGAASSNYYPYASANGLLFLIADDGAHGPELWKSDGTAQGTRLVKDIIPGAGGFAAMHVSLGVIGNMALLYIDDINANTYTLYRSDGTASGTLAYFGPKKHDGQNYNAPYMQTFNGKVYLTLDEQGVGRNLWSTDGTDAGTQPVIYGSSMRMSFPGLAVPYNNALYITARCVTKQGYCLWKLPAGASKVSLFFEWYPTSVRSLTNVNGQAVFVNAQDSSSFEDILWKFDETSGPTGVLCPSCAYDIDSYSTIPVWAGNMYFYAIDADHGSELWATDGTAAGTRLVADINPGTASSNPNTPYLTFDWMQANANNLYFPANDGANGAELWSLHIDLNNHIYLPATQK